MVVDTFEIKWDAHHIRLPEVPGSFCPVTHRGTQSCCD